MDALVIGMGKGPNESMDELCIPAKNLEVEGEKPAVGDSVDFKVSGTVTRVEGDKIYVEAEKINDQPTPEEASESPEEEQSEEDQLRGMAQKKDQEESSSY